MYNKIPLSKREILYCAGILKKSIIVINPRGETNNEGSIKLLAINLKNKYLIINSTPKKIIANINTSRFTREVIAILIPNTTKKKVRSTKDVSNVITLK
tara:strand:+ start:336 stop:632 length:297 start_codon:yes stop_codon:yes gene_type:complete